MVTWQCPPGNRLRSASLDESKDHLQEEKPGGDQIRPIRDQRSCIRQDNKATTLSSPAHRTLPIRIKLFWNRAGR